MSRYNVLLEDLFKTDEDIFIIRSLSEDVKQELSKALVESIYNAMVSKSTNLDYGMLEKSKGNFTRVEGYIHFKESLDLLNAMQNNMKERIVYLDVINNAHENILKFINDFEQGFRLKNNMVILLYNNLALALVSSVSFLISTTVDYVKDPLGDYSMHFRSNISSNKGYPTIFLDTLERFNKMAASGELFNFFSLNLGKKAFTGADIIVVGGITLTVLLLVIPLLREIIYQYFNMRVSIADYLRMQAVFVEMHKVKLSINDPKKMESVIKKQEGYVNKLIKFADKIDVDQKSSTKKANMEIDKENNNINLNRVKVAQAGDLNDSLL